MIMGLLNTFKNTVNKLAEQVDNATQNATNLYKEKGVKGLLDATDQGITKATDKTREYFQGVMEESRKQTPTEGEDGKPVSKVETSLNTAIKATQTVAQDVAQSTKNAWDKLSQEQHETASKEPEVAQDPMVEKAVIVDRLKKINEDSVTKPARKTPARKKAVKDDATANSNTTTTIKVDSREMNGALTNPGLARKHGDSLAKPVKAKKVNVDTDDTPKVTRTRKPR
jgi:hypothetical protein